jgi:copper chaperone NosL
MKVKWILISAAFIATSCSISPVEINYNEDECAFCKMKISDRRFGAELVTTKGKVYKYDSAECLLRTLAEDERNKYRYILVTDFLQPAELIDATEATFLVSPGRPSPMGGNLSAYLNHEDAISAKEDLGGSLQNFEATLEEYSQTQ